MVEKRIIVWRDAEQPLEALSHALHALGKALVDDGADAVTVDIVNPEPASLNMTRADGAVVAGLLSVRAPAVDAAAIAASLGVAPSHYAAFDVTQAVPLDYAREWPDATPSPGALQVSFIQRKPDLDHDAFVDHWHNTHTPLALRIHPLWRYERNQVRAQVGGEGPAFDGVVKLHFRSLEDITDPMRLFGGSMDNIKAIQKDVASFIDMQKIVVTVMHETIYRRP